MTGDNGAATGHGFDDGEAKSLVQRRVDERECVRIEDGEVLIRHIVNEVDVAVDPKPPCFFERGRAEPIRASGRAHLEQPK
jgi:hypothetical protein